MANLKDVAVSRGTLLGMDPRTIKVKTGLNARDMTTDAYKARVREIADSIKVRGFLQSKPIQIMQENDEVFVTAGHTRLDAVMLAISEGTDVRSIPCLIEPRGLNSVERALDQVTDNEGTPLNLLEAGKTIKVALANGWEPDQIAKHIGKSRSYVDQAIGFQEAAPEVHEAVREGKISVTLAAAIARDAATPEAAADAVKKALKVAKKEGKTKVTAKHVAPFAKKAGKPDTDLTIKGGVLGVSVQFGDRLAMVLPKSAWKKVCKEILAFVDEEAPVTNVVNFAP
jgi:ParB-like chromosome segregation protein Spo0J